MYLCIINRNMYIFIKKKIWISRNCATLGVSPVSRALYCLTVGYVGQRLKLTWLCGLWFMIILLRPSRALLQCRQPLSAGGEMSHAPHLWKHAARFWTRRYEASQRQAASVAVIEWSLQAHLQGGKQYAAQISADKWLINSDVMNRCTMTRLWHLVECAMCASCW